MLYTVIAYQWGWLNAAHYQVAATTDAKYACEIAEAECSDRGGKYGVVVYEWISDRIPRQKAYYASLYDEPAPFDNERIDLFSGIGHAIHDAVTSGVRWQEPAKNPGPSVALAVEPPDWVTAIVRKHEVDCHFRTALREADEHFKSIAQRAPSASSAEDKQELSQLVAAMNAAAQGAADAILAKVPSIRAATLEKRGAPRSAARPGTTAD